MKEKEWEDENWITHKNEMQDKVTTSIFHSSPLAKFTVLRYFGEHLAGMNIGKYKVNINCDFLLYVWHIQKNPRISINCLQVEFTIIAALLIFHC